MNIDRILLLAVAVLAATAFAAPAAASGSVWKHGTEPLEEHIELGLSGGEIFEFGEFGEESGMGCGVHATLATEGGSTAEITAWETGVCSFAFGDLSGCELVSAEPLGLPWAVDVNSEDLTITDADLRRTFDPECPVEEVESTVEEVDTTLNTPANIAELEFIGEGTAEVEPGGSTAYGAFGSFAVDGEDAGTYGIG